MAISWSRSNKPSSHGRGPSFDEVVVDRQPKQLRDTHPHETSDDATGETDGQGLDEEPTQDVSVACADCLEDTDLAAPFVYGCQQRAGDAESSDDQGHGADASEDYVDDAEITLNRRDQVLRRAGGISELIDLGANVMNSVEAGRDHDQARVLRGQQRKIGIRFASEGPRPCELGLLDRDHEIAIRHLLSHHTNDGRPGPAAAEAHRPRRLAQRTVPAASRRGVASSISIPNADGACAG